MWGMSMESMILRKRKIRIVTAAATVVIAAVIIACAVYVDDYYRADTDAIAAFSTMNPVTMQTVSSDTIAYIPAHPTAGLIFYPGGKVEYTAYEPLMRACASEGILCILAEMPFNLAVLDVNAADGMKEQFPEIESWYIGGHSLGGSMAASFLSEHTEEYDGLILLGSYSTADLSETDLAVLSVYGSEDNVLNREKYAENKANLPDDLTEIVIDGGCHAYFGMYGTQDGDGTPTISAEEQIELTVNAILKLLAAETECRIRGKNARQLDADV